MLHLVLFSVGRRLFCGLCDLSATRFRFFTGRIHGCRCPFSAHLARRRTVAQHVSLGLRKGTRETRMAKLEVWKEGTLIEEIDLSSPRSYVMGRSDAADIITDHISCSRRHAELVVEPSGGVSITDLNSSQGTFVGNREIPPGQRTPLADTSKITLGVSTRVYLLKLDRPAVGSVAAPPVLSAQEKRKLLWGNKKGASGVSLTHQRTAEANATGWSAQAAGALAGDSERQDKFLSMMGAKRHKPTEGQGEEDAAAAGAAAAAARRQEAMFDQLERQFDQASSTGGGKRRL